MSSENGSNSIGISRIPPDVGCSSYIVLSFEPTFVRYIDSQYIFDGVCRFCGDIVIGRPYFYRVSIQLLSTISIPMHNIGILSTLGLSQANKTNTISTLNPIE